MTRARAQNGKPFGFHASLLNISEGPMVCLPETALAVAASIAAWRVARFIPPEPRKSKMPRITKMIPSRNAALVGVKRGLEERNQTFIAYIADASRTEIAISAEMFLKNIVFIASSIV